MLQAFTVPSLTHDSIGTKRSYQHSPPENTSPGLQTGGLYGGAVQDYGSAQSPAVKRHRSSSEYDNSAYAGLVSETPMPYASNGIPAGGRYEPQRLGSNYTSPMQSMLGRGPSMGMQPTNQYSSLYASATSGVTTHQNQPYSTFAESQPSLPSASTVPRYQSQYSYPATTTHYGGYGSGDQQAYSDPYGPTSSHMSSMGLGSTTDPSYGFPQGSSYTEPSEAQRSYAYPPT